MWSKAGVQPSKSVLQIRNSVAGQQGFGLRWQTAAAATPLSERGPGSESGVVLRFPPQSKSVSVMRNSLRIRGPEKLGLAETLALPKEHWSAFTIHPSSFIPHPFFFCLPAVLHAPNLAAWPMPWQPIPRFRASTDSGRNLSI